MQSAKEELFQAIITYHYRGLLFIHALPTAAPTAEQNLTSLFYY